MHTLGGFRFVPIARVAGTLVGLDARWLGARGLLMVVLVVLCTPAGPLSPDGHIPLWARLAFGLASVASLALIVVITQIGLQAKIMNPDIAQALIAAALLSSLVNPTLAAALLSKASRR